MSNNNKSLVSGIAFPLRAKTRQSLRLIESSSAETKTPQSASMLKLESLIEYGKRRCLTKAMKRRKDEKLTPMGGKLKDDLEIPAIWKPICGWSR